jgi:hypothetical protein
VSITPSETVFFISTADLVIDYDIMPKKTYSGASNQSRSSVRLGSEQLGSATWMPQTRDDFDPVVARSGAPYVRRVVHGNASEVKFGKGGDGTPRDYTTATSGEFGPATSVHAASYSRAAPAPGFDRATANRTNYELGETRTDYHTANEMSTQDPKHLPSPGGPDFPKLAGRDYNPHNCAGYKHNPVTGKDDPYAVHRPLPDRFKSNDKDLYGNLVGVPREGQMHYYDLTVGRTRAKPVPGKNLLEKEVAEPPLDSLVCLRPPLEGDRRLY